MAQVNAGDRITLTIDGKPVSVKIEDASKSEEVFAKVETSAHSNYSAGNVYTFSREQFA